MFDPIENDDSLESSGALIRFNGVEVSSRIIPAAGAKRGGDWCDAFAVTDDVVGISIGDVCGHGDLKFDSMVAIRQAIRTIALRGLDPAQTLAEVNRFLCRHDPSEIATGIFALLDTRKRSMTFANAGHPPLLVADAHGALFLDYAEHDLPLGIDPDFMPVAHAVRLPEAALIVFYTDGVTENGRDSVQGSMRLVAAAKFVLAFPELPSATTIEAMTLSTGSNFDDAAILTMRLRSLPVFRNTRSKDHPRGAVRFVKVRPARPYGAGI
jgi:serine phosphatase RsbU (regulator of sigma subunit)